MGTRGHIDIPTPADITYGSRLQDGCHPHGFPEMLARGLFLCFLFRNIFRSNLSLAALNWSLPPSPVAVSSNATLQISGTHPATNSKSTRSRTTFPASSKTRTSHTRKMIDQSVSGRSSTHCHGQPWVRLDVLELDARRHVFVEQLLQEIAALGAQRLGELVGSSRIIWNICTRFAERKGTRGEYRESHRKPRCPRPCR